MPGNPDKIKGKGFRERPENINRNGRPRRFVSSVIVELEKLGIENVKPSQVVDLYEKLMNCTVVQLKEYANDENTAWEVRQTAKYMLTNPDKAWNEVKDRAHGKARQTDTIEHTGRIITGFEFV
jgi:hypothetical protein